MGAAFAYDTYTTPSKRNGVLGATLTDKMMNSKIFFLRNGNVGGVLLAGEGV